jgi:hypothetical protein
MDDRSPCLLSIFFLLLCSFFLSFFLSFLLFYLLFVFVFSPSCSSSSPSRSFGFETDPD